jgi:uncharacterized protein YkwD
MNKKPLIAATSTFVIAFVLFIANAQPKTVISSAAMSFTNVDMQMDIRRDSTGMPQMPTMRPFPSIKVTYTDTVVQFPRATTTGAVLPGNTTPRPTTAASPTSSNSATASPTSTPTNTSTPRPTTAAAPSGDVTDQVITLVNNERAKVGLGPLTKNESLTTSAQNYAQYMGDNNFFSHTAPNGSTFITRNTGAGYTNYRWIGENIAAGQTTPSSAMRDWMNSSGHKANILSTNAKEIGVGYAKVLGSQYTHYWVQEFGAR